MEFGLVHHSILLGSCWIPSGSRMQLFHYVSRAARSPEQNMARETQNPEPKKRTDKVCAYDIPQDLGGGGGGTGRSCNSAKTN